MSARVLAKNASARSMGRKLHLGLGIVDFWQAVNLLDVEYGLALHERNLALDFVAGTVVLGLDDGVGIDDK